MTMVAMVTTKKAICSFQRMLSDKNHRDPAECMEDLQKG